MTLSVKTIRHIGDVGPFCLRYADQCECRATGKSIPEVVQLSIKNSTEAYAVYYRKNLMVLWGFQRGTPTAVWMLTTAMVDLYPLIFYREGKRLLALMLQEFGEIECVVWKPYKKAVAWLEHLGFSRHTDQAGMDMSEFVRMTKGNS